ncbi:M23 family metallopeptidase [Streptomyces anulatus]|uniref:M23 family metallopeptidase n=1 Tax=Streptomyces anulatus TaxID=1892 RepID=UPI00340171E3
MPSVNVPRPAPRGVAVGRDRPWAPGLLSARRPTPVTRGPEGTYSHTGPCNEYAWDFGVPADYEVSAARAGTIVFSNRSPYRQNGIEVLIRHSNGRCTHCAHLNRSCHEPGDRVPRGRIVGRSGSTGASTAPHLRFQVIDCESRVGLPATIQGRAPYAGTRPVSVNQLRLTGRTVHRPGPPLGPYTLGRFRAKALLGQGPLGGRAAERSVVVRGQEGAERAAAIRPGRSGRGP